MSNQASPPHKRPRRFWYLLVEKENGKPYMETTVDAVSLEQNNGVVDFRDAVKGKNDDDLLKGISSSKLLVYKNKAAFEKRNLKRGKQEPLKASLRLGDLGCTEDDSLYVAVPAVIPSPVVVTDQAPAPTKILFYKKISMAVERNGWIHFQTNIPILDMITNRLYVRKSYKTIADAILNGDQKRSIVTGTPGIGKTFFLVYFLWRLVRENKRVLFIYHPKMIYYDGKGKILRLTTLPSEEDFEFWNMDLWSLFDAKGKLEQDLLSIPSELCKTVVSTSPRRELLNEFQKESSLKWMYMPIWSKSELRTISCMYPRDLDWEKRFSVLGGIPRLVLQKTEEDSISLLDEACRTCSLDECLKVTRSGTSITEKMKVLQCLVHITSSHPYVVPSVRFASAKALEVVVKEKAAEAYSTMTTLLKACDRNPLTATLCRHLYEEHAIKQFEIGGTFTCRKVHDAKTKVAEVGEFTISIRKQERARVDKVKDGQTGDQLYVPLAKNYPAIDAWIPSIGGFQITIATTHSIKKSSMPIFQMLQNKLFWVLPTVNYFSFTHEALSDASIQQYALHIPYP